MTAPAIRASALASAAERYAAEGWHVFPLTPRDKKPLAGSRGFLEATADVERVRAWWRDVPDANIGLAPGPSGLVVIDLDGPQAEEAASRLGILSEPTLECRTGRPEGGRHLYFRHPYPNGHIPNGKLAAKIDVRADAGYVILPPSVHPTGARYQWLGKVAELRDCPERLADALRVMGTSQLRGLAERAGVELPADIGAPARDIPTLEALTEGARNETLARYAGRLLAKGVEVPEVLALVSALNAQKCKPPLPGSEVTAVVASIAKREAAKASRVTSTGTVLTAASPPDDGWHGYEEEPTPADLAAMQTSGAQQLLTRDLTRAPRWGWPDLRNLVGPMLPGDLVVIGALMGNGKTSLLMSQMDAWALARIPVLYLPLEVDPEVCRLRWAAWRLSLDVRHVIRQDWGALPEGSCEAVHAALDELERDPCIHFVPDKRVTVATLARWVRWGVEHAGARVVMVDHFHRMDVGGGTTFRVSSTEAARQCKDLARDAGVVMLAAAQLNRSGDPLDPLVPPPLARIKETAGLAEEADVVLMLSRRLARTATDEDVKALRAGRVSEADLTDRGVMVVTCRKHRLDDSALNRSITLTVENNRVVSHDWRHA